MYYLSSKQLQKHPQITHTFTTRHGGVSTAPFDSNNLAFHVGDDADVVRQNHALLAKQLDYDLERLVHMRQIHSDIVVIVDPEVHNFDNPPECDALVTDKPGIPLMVMTADCTPVLLFDPIQNVIAVAHAGRAGAVKGIVPKTIEKMCSDFGSSIEDINVVLGPSIHGCCYEVGKQIAQAVFEDGFGFAVIAREGSYYLEVNAIIKKQLEDLGIKKEKLEDINICNACENQDFFSYRADKQKTGRIAGVLMLK
ncbi:MAG: peptidoglycan editing factor PgeF [Helicobacteraceae bacterium]|jgi:YfiH family protein|nr:peptidoglycan editing factor PgeF [Helicobacteraceae bacterium]